MGAIGYTWRELDVAVIGGGIGRPQSTPELECCLAINLIFEQEA